MRRHFVSLLALVQINDLLRVDWQPLVGIDYHAKESRVSLCNKNKQIFFLINKESHKPIRNRVIRDERLFYIQRENVSVRDERRPYKTRSWEILFFTRGNSRNSKRSHLYTHAFLSLFPSLLTSLSLERKKNLFHSIVSFIYLHLPKSGYVIARFKYSIFFCTRLLRFFFERGGKERVDNEAEEEEVSDKKAERKPREREGSPLRLLVRLR